MWNGQRILDEDWVDAATRAQVANPQGDDPDWRQGYGFQFWMARHGFRGDGAYGQFCVVLPEQDVVLALTGQTPDMQAVLDAAWTHLLPAVDAADLDVAEDTGLEARLASLGLPPVGGDPLPDLAAVGPLHASGDLSGLDTVTFGRDGASQRMTATVEGQELTVTLGEGEWAVDGPLAASAAIDPADGALLVDVRFVETPHLAHLRADLSTATVSTSWATQPLHDGPLTLRRPAD
ncbi:serine hydrolase [Curtobacterium flaccumfaciens]|nr:serine hydrolase [Curtobacterium flaccumfaciens]